MDTVLGITVCVVLVAWLFGIAMFLAMLTSASYQKSMFIFLTPIGGFMVIFYMLFDFEAMQKTKVRRYSKKHNTSLVEARCKLYPSEWWLDDPNYS